MRVRMAGLVAATMSLVLVAFLVPIGILLWREAEQRAIAAASLEVQTLAALVAVDEAAAAGSVVGRAADAPIITIFMPDGTIHGAPAEPTPSVQLAQLGQAFSADTEGGVELLVPVQGLSGGTAVIRSYVPAAQLHDGVWQSVLTLGLLALALFAVGVALADRLGQRLVGSVSALAATANRLASGDIGARVNPSGPPELRHVGAAFNHLAGQIGEQLDAVRAEVADLAHRLRTPVTALRLDAESLRDPDERARLGADVDDLSRMVDEVIRTARRPVREGAHAMADLAAIAKSRADFWAPLAEDTGRRLDQMIPLAPVVVGVSSGDLKAVLDALLGNVFAHTPDGTAMRISVGRMPDGGGRLIVEDAGPGFAGNRLGAAARAAGSGIGTGTGLGLDIARRTAEASGGRLHLGDSAMGGALIDVCFGPP